MRLIKIAKLLLIVFVIQFVYSSFVFAENDLGTKANPYCIKTKEELLHFAQIVNGTVDDSSDKNSSACAILMADIVINEQDLSNGTSEGATEWTPIGNSAANKYTGEFDGNGYEIQGLYVKNGEARGLFGYVGGTIKNLKVTKSYIDAIQSGCSAGMIAGKAENAIISNCTSSGFVSGGNDVDFGGLIGCASGTEISNCVNYSNVKNTNNYDHANAGGIAGFLANGSKITDCTNSGLLYLISNEARQNNAGGICGLNSSSVILNCKNEVKITSYGRNNLVGGIVGLNESGSVVANSENNGIVEGFRDDNIGGIAGENNNSRIAGCVNNAEMKYTDMYVSIGGIAAYNKNNGIISACKNTGYLKGLSNNLAGIVTYLSNATVEKCVNEGRVSGNKSTYISGIVAQLSSGAVVTNCYNIGEVSNINGGISCGIVSNAYGTGNKIKNSYNAGKCSSSPIAYNANAEILNCYYLQESEVDSLEGTTFKTAQQFESGEVCYLLNGGSDNCTYYQTLGTDKIPYFCGKKVYHSAEKGYYNDENNGELNFNEECLVTGGATGNVVIIAGYADGKMVYLKEYPLSKDISISMIEVAEKLENVDKYCAFLLSGYDELRPLCEKESFEIIK